MRATASLLLLLLGACVGDEPPEPYEGVVVGNPGSSRFRVAHGVDMDVVQVQLPRAAVRLQDLDGDWTTVEMPAPAPDETDPVVELPAGTYDRLQLVLYDTLDVTFELSDGALTELSLDVGLVDIEGQVDTEEGLFLWELGQPGWITPDLLDDASVLGLVQALRDGSSLYPDTGDGVISEEIRTEGALATASVATVEPPRVVAVGASARRLASDDGITWFYDQAEGDSDETNDLFLYDVTWGVDRFVAVGGLSNSLSYVSLDGQTWTPNFSVLEDKLSSVASGNGRFVGVSETGRRATSYGGLTWTDSTRTELAVYDVAFGLDTFVCVGESGLIGTSTTGEVWDDVTGGDKLYDIAFYDGIFVAVGREGRISRSTDAVNWTDHSVPGSDLQSVAAGSQGFLASGSGRVLRSEDGITWTTVSESTWLEQIVALDDSWLAIAWPDQRFISSDGEIWERIEGGTGPALGAITVRPD